MERTLIWLIAASTLLIGILLWSKKEAARPTPQFNPMIDVRTLCAGQADTWCHETLPGDERYMDRRRCSTDYFPRCMGCMLGIEYRRRRGIHPGALSNGCRALEQWKNSQPRPDPAAVAPQWDDQRRQ